MEAKSKSFKILIAAVSLGLMPVISWADDLEISNARPFREERHVEPNVPPQVGDPYDKTACCIDDKSGLAVTLPRNKALPDACKSACRRIGKRATFPKRTSLLCKAVSKDKIDVTVYTFAGEEANKRCQAECGDCRIDSSPAPKTVKPPAAAAQ